MAQYRTSAFESAQRLPTRLTATALELAADLSRDHLNQLLRRLQADRWLTPAQALTGASTSSLTIVKQVGAFRGFGGPFMRPPSVCCQREELLVTDGEATWRLIADACGGVLIRATEKMNREPGSNVTVDSRGSVRWNGESAIFPELAHVKSFAAANQTLAVTLPTSHHIFLLAKAPQDDVRPHGGPTRVG
jgi:hypothetical protein